MYIYIYIYMYKTTFIWSVLGLLQVMVSALESNNIILYVDTERLYWVYWAKEVLLIIIIIIQKLVR